MKNRSPRIFGVDWRWAAVGGLVAFYLYRERMTPGSKLLGWRTKSVIDDFKTKLQPIANIVEAETGIKAALGITQAALESAYGQSALSKPSAVLGVYVGDSVVRKGPANNLFGIKANKGWVDSGSPHVRVITTEYPKDGSPTKIVQPFRAYSSWEESYRDWARLMQTAAYVADGALEALTKGDVVAFGQALSKRYAPNQNYDKRLEARAREMGVLA